VGSGVWAHAGSGRRLVGRLKYDGVVAVAALAAASATGPPVGAQALVPVPRVLARRVTTGVDAAEVFAQALGRQWGIPVVRALSAPVWAPRRAGRLRRPGPPGLVVGGRVPGAVVVDDVITTGATVRLAAGLLGATAATAITLAAKSPAARPPLRTMASGIRR
jgi:predicted amidophosphoribosyltransferase